jgi:tRNA/tmRNA/rRNA uracil-C5-methylase (TrmA/RlmC/RlmD family)
MPDSAVHNATPLIADVASLDQEGRGVACIDGKAFFVEGALP